MFFHRQLLLVVVFVHHHDLSFGTFSIHHGIVFVVAPRSRHDDLQVASFPSFSRCLLRDCSCEPQTILVPRDEFHRGVALMPKHKPSSHMHINFLGRVFFHKFLAATGKACTLRTSTGLFSMIILDPLSIALSVLHDAIKLVSAGSLSDFPMMSTNSDPISRAHAISLRHVKSLVNFLVSLPLGHPKRQRLPFLFVAHECVIRLDFWDLSHSLLFSCFATVLCWLPSLDALSAPTAERKVRHLVFFSFLFVSCRGSLFRGIFHLPNSSSSSSFPCSSDFPCSTSPTSSIFVTHTSFLASFLFWSDSITDFFHIWFTLAA